MEHAAVSSLHFMVGKNDKLLLWQKQNKIINKCKE